MLTTQSHRIDDLFVATAQRFADLVAIDAGDRVMTYREVLRYVEAYARLLPGRGPVGLIADKHPLTCCLYLAVLLAGRTVVPISMTAPVSRVAGILDSASIQTVVRHVNAPWPYAQQLGVAEIVVDDAAPTRASSSPVVTAPDDRAYILHTSGSTGAPKAVPVTHLSVLAYLDRVVSRYELAPGARLSSTFELTFDLAVFDLLGGLCSGSTIVLPCDREQLLPSSYTVDRRLTHWFSVPSSIPSGRNFGDLQPGSMPDLRWSLFCGEPLRLDHAQLWKAAAPSSIIENLYGPTELTLACSDYRLPVSEHDWPSTSNGTVPIGRIYPGLDWRVGSRRSAEELLVRGVQRFAGYLDPSQNAVAFQTDSDRDPSTGHSVDPSAWYCTGDRVQVQDGQLVHLGRVDRQVKVRGHRIELEEVERAYRDCPFVTEASAAVISAGTDQLLAVALVGDRSRDRKVREQVRQRLPSYMVPERTMWLDQLPLNPNGKISSADVRIALQTGSSARWV